MVQVQKTFLFMHVTVVIKFDHIYEIWNLKFETREAIGNCVSN